MARNVRRAAGGWKAPRTSCGSADDDWPWRAPRTFLVSGHEQQIFFPDFPSLGPDDAFAGAAGVELVALTVPLIALPLLLQG